MQVGRRFCRLRFLPECPTKKRAWSDVTAAEPKQHIRLPRLLSVPKDRPTSVLWDPDEEFASNTEDALSSWRRPWWCKMRAVFLHHGIPLHSRVFSALLLPGSLVLLVGAQEGALLLDSTATPADAALFCAAYAWQNLFSSCIWMTKPPDLVRPPAPAYSQI